MPAIRGGDRLQLNCILSQLIWLNNSDRECRAGITSSAGATRSKPALLSFLLPNVGAERDGEARAVNDQTRGGDHGETGEARSAETYSDPAAGGDHERPAGGADERPQRPARCLER